MWPVWTILTLCSVLQDVSAAANTSHEFPTSRESLMEHALKQYLFRDEFDPSVRPVEDSSDNVTVYVDVSLNYLVDMNEKLQTLQSAVWVRLAWKDFQLAWDPSEFGNVTVCHLEVGRIWTPDIVIYNEIGLESGKDPKDFRVKITSDGMVQWNFPRTIETSCKLNVFNFPFDSQKCIYMFGSWTYPGNLIDVRNVGPRGDLTRYLDDGEWDLLDITVERHVLHYECCPEPYPDVTFTLVLQRRSLYYFYNIIMPCVVITMLHLVSFLLPAESGEKISLNVTILLGLTVFLLLVAEIMPPQSHVIPVIGQYFGICIVQVSLSTVVSVIILHLHFRGSRGFPVPSWFRSLVFGKLGYLLCYRSLIEQTSNKQNRQRAKHKRRKDNQMQNGGKVELLNVRVSPLSSSENHSNGVTSFRDDERDNRSRSGMYRHDNADGKAPTVDLGALHREIEDKEEAEKAIIQDWILVSLILDRFFFVLFGVLEIITLIFVMRYAIVEGT